MSPEAIAILALAALLGGLAGAWIAARRRTAEPELLRLALLIEQSARSAREDTDSLRKSMADSERALGARIEAVTAAATKLSVDLPAALDAEGTKTKFQAAEANKTLRDALAAALHQNHLEAAKFLGEFREALSERLDKMGNRIVQFGGDMNTVLAENQTKTVASRAEEFAKLLTRVDAKINEMRESNEAKLLQIQGIVDQKLQEGIEKRMTESFAKITAQFAEVQQAVGEVKTVAGQVGDLKRLFSNVKARGGWGEAQVKATLDDILPPGSYETNMRVNPATSDAVEFALKLPVQGGAPVYLAIDAKFPVEDYGRLIEAAEAGDASGERSARAALEQRIRLEAKTIQTKYIAPPHTVEWAILYLPSEGLYAEVTRNADLMESIHRGNRVIIMGPSMLAVMLRTIQLGHYTLAISQKADLIGQILGAVKHEMVDFGRQFTLLERNIQALGNNIKKGHTRARVISRKLKDISALEGPASATLLDIPPGDDADEDVDLEAME